MSALLVSAPFAFADSEAEFHGGVAALQAENYQAAMEAWSKCPEDARCQYSLGYLEQFGLGVTADYGKAREWYEKAAQQNHPDALYALGLMFETGKAGQKDLGKAIGLYRQAAETGKSPDAEYAVGRMILRGRGVPRDPAEGVKWLRRAADHGQVAAQYMMGAAYEAGWGVSPDLAEAYYWYRRSQQGDPVELADHDMSFQPQIAIDSLKRRMSANEIRLIEARLKKGGGKKAAKSED
ncbi:MAG TPA: tetratricopeptide repeat protein [Candidatus Sulfotelmatobacter sp.]|nr:tetratricopeptide repeat protein [Candidatus Sulfotelmatobacter sp.]